MTQATELYDKWIRAWNGEMDLIDEIISPDFHFHPTNEESGEDYSGRDGVRKMITSSRTLFTPITFSIEIDPIIQGDLLAARWIGEGQYAGGFPGATAEPGTRVHFSAIDILRFKDGKFIEYWHNADDLTFMSSIGAVSFNG